MKRFIFVILGLIFVSTQALALSSSDDYTIETKMRASSSDFIVLQTDDDQDYSDTDETIDTTTTTTTTIYGGGAASSVESDDVDYDEVFATTDSTPIVSDILEPSQTYTVSISNEYGEEIESYQFETDVSGQFIYELITKLEDGVYTALVLDANDNRIKEYQFDISTDVIEPSLEVMAFGEKEIVTLDFDGVMDLGRILMEEDSKLYGYAVPFAEVIVYFHSDIWVEETVADEFGYFEVPIPGHLGEGAHTAYITQIYPDSTISEDLTYTFELVVPSEGNVELWAVVGSILFLVFLMLFARGGMKRWFARFAVIVLLVSVVQVGHPFADSVPEFIVYDGRLLSSSGEVVSSEYDFRFSFWSDADFDGDVIEDAAWYEEQTVTLDSDGGFSVHIGEVTPLPVFDSEVYKFLQVEIKAHGQADTEYQLMDPTGDNGADEIDREALGLTYYAYQSHSAEGSLQDVFVIDIDDTATSEIGLQFGSAIEKILSYDIEKQYFNFNDDVNIEGDLTISGLVDGYDISGYSGYATLADSESLIVDHASRESYDYQVTALLSVNNTGLTDESLDFSDESLYEVEDSEVGTDFIYGGVRLHNSGGSLQSYEYDVSSYDEEKIDFEGGVASLKKVSVGDDFSNGSHDGIAISGDSSLVLSGATEGAFVSEIFDFGESVSFEEFSYEVNYETFDVGDDPYEFSGDSYEDVAGVSGPMSVEFWFKTEEAGGLFDGVYVGQDGKIHYEGYATSSEVVDGEWHHLVVSDDIYLDGVSQSFDISNVGDGSNLELGYAEVPVGEALSVSNVSDDWQAVSLDNSYANPVIVCTYNLPSLSSNPAVTRINNIGTSSFDLKLQSPSGSSVTSGDVYCVVIDEGDWTLTNGVSLEAFAYQSTSLDYSSNWVGEEIDLVKSYTTPVIFGQVMSYNDERWSVFWDRGSSSRGVVPSAGDVYIGMHIGQDPDISRDSEILGYIVVEEGMGTVNGIDYEVYYGADSVGGMSTAVPFQYSVSGDYDMGILTQAAMDGSDGGWAVFYGEDPIRDAEIDLAIDEDKVGDSERYHTTEQAAYWLFSEEGTLTVDGYFVGSIDDVVVHDGYLTQEEVLNDYLGGVLDATVMSRTCYISDCSDQSFGEFSPGTEGQYFQYQVVMGTDDISYSPEISDIYIGTDVYYDDSPAAMGGGDEFTVLVSFGDESTGDIRYQVSNDGMNYYYWDGSAWVYASASSQSNTAADINANAASFEGGEFYWKAFFVSDGSAEASLDSVSVELSTASYPVGESYYVVTTAESQLTGVWGEVHGVTVEDAVPDGTVLKYLVSFDGRSSWYYWDGDAWVLAGSDLDAEGVFTNANNSSELEAVSDWSLVDGVLDFSAVFWSSEIGYTSSLDQITLNYDEPEIWRVIDGDSQYPIDFISDTQTRITNNSGQTQTVRLYIR